MFEGGQRFDGSLDYEIDAGVAPPSRAGAESAGWGGINADGTGIVYDLGYGEQYDTGTGQMYHHKFDTTPPEGFAARIDMMMAPSDN